MFALPFALVFVTVTVVLRGAIDVLVGFVAAVAGAWVCVRSPDPADSLPRAIAARRR